MTISENESIAPIAGGDHERMLRAQRVLDLVSHNERARADLVAAYDGPGDVLEALRRAADPGTAAADRLVIEQLRKLAFGRTTTDEEHQAAADALSRLRDLESVPADIDAALDRALTSLATMHDSAGAEPNAGMSSGAGADFFGFASGEHGAGSGSAFSGFDLGAGAEPDHSHPDSLQTAHATTAARHGQRPARTRLIVGGVAFVALLIGGVLGAGVVGTGLTRGFIGASSELTPGDLDAANSWFDVDQTADDEVPSTLGDTINLASTRLVHESGTQVKIWLARGNGDGAYCMVSSSQPDSYALTCVDPAQFEKTGLALADGLTQINWDGTTVTVALSAS